MLPKLYRLRKSADIQETSSRGRGFFNRFFSIKFKRNELGRRFTVVVSTKVSKRAVIRNRLKRIVREKLKEVISTVPTGDYAIILKVLAAQSDEKEVLSEFSRLLRQIK